MTISWLDVLQERSTSWERLTNCSTWISPRIIRTMPHVTACLMTDANCIQGKAPDNHCKIWKWLTDALRLFCAWWFIGSCESLCASIFQPITWWPGGSELATDRAFNKMMSQTHLQITTSRLAVGKHHLQERLVTIQQCSEVQSLVHLQHI